MSYGMDGWCKEIPGGDLISRAEAIKALGKEGLITAMVIVDRVPSAQPERKNGRWSGSCCSVCGVSKYNFVKILHIDSGYCGTWNYCPNCGADMRGEQDGNTD